ncbi:MAG: DNA-3-methyladenine glycosylase I [Candidatus Geothermarchaeales archaeon]
MSKSVFQSGISRRVVESKWSGIREAFGGFEPGAVAGFTEADVDEMVKDKKVIRNRRKLEAIVGNARRMLELEEKHGSFQGYLRSHATFDDTVADLRRQFKFLGEFGSYHFLYVVGEKVPSYEEWCASRGIEPRR